MAKWLLELINQDGYVNVSGSYTVFQGQENSSSLERSFRNTTQKFIRAQAEIKIARRNIYNLRYADNTTLMAESEENLKNLLMKVKELSEKLP